MRKRERYRELILENIDYDILTQDERLDKGRLDELVELMVDTVSPTGNPSVLPETITPRKWSEPGF